MESLRIRIPKGLQDELKRQVEQDKYFKDVSEAARYHIRSSLQREEA